MENIEWEKFNGSLWKTEINVSDFIKCNYKEYISLQEELYFEENVLYDFVETGSDDFYDFLD